MDGGNEVETVGWKEKTYLYYNEQRVKFNFINSDIEGIGQVTWWV